MPDNQQVIDEGIIPDRYLGDGVYASFDGYHIVLDLRGQDTTTRIALEPMVLHELKGFQTDVSDRIAELAAKENDDAK